MILDYRSHRKRPVSLKAWARPMALTFLVVAYVASLEGRWAYTAGLLAVSLVLVVWWWHAPVDRRFAMEFPYEYIADLPPERSATADRDRLPTTSRAVWAAALAGALWASWALFDPTRSGVATAVAPAAMAGIWAYEIPYRPGRWIACVSLVAGVAAGAVFALLGMLVDLFRRTSTARLAAAFLVGAVAVASFLFVLLSLHAAATRYPSRILER